jgi:hypothetical protein
MSWLKTFVEGAGGAALMVIALLTPFLRGWRVKWGATNKEVNRSWPGDDLVPRPKWGWTHVLTVRASAAQVWPWLVQMGQGRGGFYSYEFLENVVGCDIHNADRIVPELQQLQVGDSIRLYPKMSGLLVAVLEPGRALVLSARTDEQTGESFELGDTMPEKYVNMAWGWFLVETEGSVTRLITRLRNDYNPSLGRRLSLGPLWVEPVGFVMSRKMLQGIKKRAEAAARRDSEREG